MSSKSCVPTLKYIEVITELATQWRSSEDVTPRHVNAVFRAVIRSICGLHFDNHTSATTHISDTKSALPSSLPKQKPSTAKKPKPSPESGYAAPSTFAHLGADPLLGPNPLVLFYGLNPGIKTAKTYSNPTNRFWKYAKRPDKHKRRLHSRYFNLVTTRLRTCFGNSLLVRAATACSAFGPASDPAIIAPAEGKTSYCA